MCSEDAHGSDDFPVLGFFVPSASCTTDESTCSGDGVGVLSLSLVGSLAPDTIARNSVAAETRKKRSQREKFMHWRKSGSCLKFSGAADKNSFNFCAPIRNV